VFVEGRLKTRRWQDSETGADRYNTEIIADQMQMLGSRDNGQAEAAPAAPASRAKGRGGKGKAPTAAPTEDEGADIPF
jgi:single-strand DNA-binding protein